MQCAENWNLYSFYYSFLSRTWFISIQSSSVDQRRNARSIRPDGCLRCRCTGCWYVSNKQLKLLSRQVMQHLHIIVDTSLWKPPMKVCDWTSPGILCMSAIHRICFSCVQPILEGRWDVSYAPPLNWKHSSKLQLSLSILFAMLALSYALLVFLSSLLLHCLIMLALSYANHLYPLFLFFSSLLLQRERCAMSNAVNHLSLCDPVLDPVHILLLLYLYYILISSLMFLKFSLFICSELHKDQHVE